MNKEQQDFIVDKLIRIDGHVVALTVAIQALLLETPDPISAAARTKERVERLLSQGLGKPVSDSFLAGVQEGLDALFPDRSIR